jgi:hypothetical protein
MRNFREGHAKIFWNTLYLFDDEKASLAFSKREFITID